MKKLSLSKIQVGSKEILTREQLKNVLGGVSKLLSGDCSEEGEGCFPSEGANCCNLLKCEQNACVKI